MLKSSRSKKKGGFFYGKRRRRRKLSSQLASFEQSFTFRRFIKILQILGFFIQIIRINQLDQMCIKTGLLSIAQSVKNISFP